MLRQVTSAAILVGSAYAAISANECNRMNNMITQHEVFDDPCSTWNEPACGTLDEETGIWSQERCQYKCDSCDEGNHFPNGFRSAQIYDMNSPGFVLKVPGSARTMVRIIVENDNPNQEICIQSTDYDDQSVQAGGTNLATRCEVGKTNYCFWSDTVDTELRFFCDNDCEGEFAFKYKVMTSTTDRDPSTQVNSAVDRLEMWCMREATEPDFKYQITYPSEMTGAEYVPKTYIDILDDGLDNANGAGQYGTTSVFAMVAMVIAYIM